MQKKGVKNLKRVNPVRVELIASSFLALISKQARLVSSVRAFLFSCNCVTT